MTPQNTPRPLPVRDYLDPEVFQRDLTHVFERAWIPVARESESMDAITPVQLGRRSLLLTVTADTLHAVDNVCRHRGRILVDAPCAIGPVRCPFHGLSYHPDGTVQAVPDGLPESLSRSALPSVRAARWGGWVWLCASSEAPSLQDFLTAELAGILGLWLPSDLALQAHAAWEEPFHWRLGVESFLESLHAPSVHPDSVHRIFDHRRATWSRHGPHSIMGLPFRYPHLYEAVGPVGRDGLAAGVPMFEGLSQTQRQSSLTVHLFPATTITLLPNHVSVVHAWPLALGRTRMVHELYGRPSTDDGAWYGQVRRGYDHIVDQDMHNLRAVQRGLQTGSLRTMLLSDSERRIADFHDTLRAWHARP